MSAHIIAFIHSPSYRQSSAGESKGCWKNDHFLGIYNLARRGNVSFGLFNFGFIYYFLKAVVYLSIDK